MITAVNTEKRTKPSVSRVWGFRDARTITRKTTATTFTQMSASPSPVVNIARVGERDRVNMGPHTHNLFFFMQSTRESINHTSLLHSLESGRINWRQYIAVQKNIYDCKLHLGEITKDEYQEIKLRWYNSQYIVDHYIEKENNAIYQVLSQKQWTTLLKNENYHTLMKTTTRDTQVPWKPNYGTHCSRNSFHERASIGKFHLLSVSRTFLHPWW